MQRRWKDAVTAVEEEDEYQRKDGRRGDLYQGANLDREGGDVRKSGQGRGIGGGNGLWR